MIIAFHTSVTYKSRVSTWIEHAVGELPSLMKNWQELSKCDFLLAFSWSCRFFEKHNQTKFTGKTPAHLDRARRGGEVKTSGWVARPPCRPYGTALAHPLRLCVARMGVDHPEPVAVDPSVPKMFNKPWWMFVNKNRGGFACTFKSRPICSMLGLHLTKKNQS